MTEQGTAQHSSDDDPPPVPPKRLMCPTCCGTDLDCDDAGDLWTCNRCGQRSVLEVQFDPDLPNTRQLRPLGLDLPVDFVRPTEFADFDDPPHAEGGDATGKR
jgi:hypothetical protein